jgi:hypothetical protein
MDKQEIEQQLREIAFKRSTAFCYQCYTKCPDGYCSKCGSDDLMRCLDGVGVEYGTSWIVEHILGEELAPANVEEAFEESVRQCYPEQTIVGWMTFDTVGLMKEQDPVSWRCALSEYESQEESEENIVSFDGGSTYFDRYDLETFIEGAAS